ncbi:MAG: hypothetical protein FWD52_04755 [Candidatus Bathyarchaeota archaeon]|nr:hypothetical protein [Candidatus Termiticorpusculum sp.]
MRVNKTGSRREFINRFGKPLEDYPSFTRATTGLSDATITNYLKRLHMFCLFVGEDPDTMIANRQADLKNDDVIIKERYEQHIKNYIAKLKKDNCVVSPAIGVICGFFKNNSSYLQIRLDNKVKYSKENKYDKYAAKRADVQKLLSITSNKRDIALITLAFHTGATPVDLASFKVGEYPLEPWKSFNKLRSKTLRKWFGVSTPDCCKAIKGYMLSRGIPEDAKLSKLHPEPLFMGHKGALDASAISEVIALLIEKAGLGSVPNFVAKSLRDGFYGVLKISEVDHVARECMMGHTGNVYHVYGDAEIANAEILKGMQKAYPLLQLSEGDVLQSSGSGLTESGLKFIAQLSPHMEKIVKFLENMDDVLYLSDPDLKEKLKQKGVI